METMNSNVRLFLRFIEAIYFEPRNHKKRTSPDENLVSNNWRPLVSTKRATLHHCRSDNSRNGMDCWGRTLDVYQSDVYGF